MSEPKIIKAMVVEADSGDSMTCTTRDVFRADDPAILDWKRKAEAYDARLTVTDEEVDKEASKGRIGSMDDIAYVQGFRNCAKWLGEKLILKEDGK